MAGQAICIATLGDIFHNFTKDCKKECLAWAKDVMNDSKENYVPIDTGLLKSTGHVYVWKETLLEYLIKLAYNTNGEANYAIYVHQIPTYYHPHGQYNFLKTPYMIRSPELMARLQKVKEGL